MSDAETPGIALIGCGGMASNYRDNYAGIPGTVYRLVVDINAETARKVAEEFGVERYSTDWRDALSNDVQIVDVSTPNHVHAEQAVALLNAGKHVILQKPMAPTVAECRQIVAAARESGKQAAVYMSDLEDPAVWDLREIVRGGYLGRITGARARYAHRGGLRASADPANWRGSAEKTGGGSFMQLSIHHTNLLSWLLDDRIKSVTGMARNLMCENIGGDDTCAAVAEYERTGVIAVFDSAWNAEGNGLELYGSEGTVQLLGLQGAAVRVHLNRPFTGRVLTVPDNSPTLIPAMGSMGKQCQPDNPFNQHVAFVRAVRSGEAFPVSAEIGLYDVAVVQAVYQSSREGRQVSVSEVLS